MKIKYCIYILGFKIKGEMNRDSPIKTDMNNEYGIISYHHETENTSIYKANNYIFTKTDRMDHECSRFRLTHLLPQTHLLRHLLLVTD